MRDKMTDGYINYFAYGSNMHPKRMKARVPSAEKVGIAALTCFSICFHKKGWKDGSGKCNAYFTGNSNDQVIGVLYKVLVQEKKDLDTHEGVGEGYEVKEVVVSSDRTEIAAFTYIASSTHINGSLQPYSWYKEYVIHGARYNGLPEDYIEMISKTVAVDDPDACRAEKEFKILRASFI